jgi:hypothetical protein
LGFAKRLARLRLLGRFLGLVVSLPHWPLSRMLENDKLEQQTATATQTQTAATAAAAATPSSTSAAARPSISISSSSTELPSPSSVSPSVASTASSATIPPRAAPSSLQVAAEADAEIEGSAEAERDASGAAARRALLQEAVAELSAATSPPPFMHIYADSSGAESGADWCSMMMAAGAEGFAPLAHLRDACARGKQGHMHPTLSISLCVHVHIHVHVCLSGLTAAGDGDSNDVITCLTHPAAILTMRTRQASSCKQCLGSQSSSACCSSMPSHPVPRKSFVRPLVIRFVISMRLNSS